MPLEIPRYKKAIKNNIHFFITSKSTLNYLLYTHCLPSLGFTNNEDEQQLNCS